ncbi:MAG TPA: hypothetical protein VLF94_00580 [Chlamydiales bacterium]|nr:hypothetical protein [Chlamydiales bacterium]
MIQVSVKRDVNALKQLEKVISETVQDVGTAYRIKQLFCAVVADNVDDITISPKSDEKIHTTVRLKAAVRKKGNFLRDRSVLYVPQKLEFDVHKEGISFEWAGSNAPYEEVPGCSITKERWTWREFTKGSKDDHCFVLDSGWWTGVFYPCCGGVPWERRFSIMKFNEFIESFSR